MEIHEPYNVINTLSLWLTVSQLMGRLAKSFFCEEELVIIEGV